MQDSTIYCNYDDDTGSGLGILNFCLRTRSNGSLEIGTFVTSGGMHNEGWNMVGFEIKYDGGLDSTSLEILGPFSHETTSLIANKVPFYT